MAFRVCAGIHGKRNPVLDDGFSSLPQWAAAAAGQAEMASSVCSVSY
jgi:hypothetical protein